MQTAVGYIRVSTESQAEDGVSLEAQRRKITAWCEANGYRLLDIYMDAGISGKRADNRPALQQALDAVCVSPGSALIVYSLSRLARSTKDTMTIAERLDSHKADLVSLSEKIDTTTAAGKMVFRLLAVLAEFERDLAAERIRFALASKRERGLVYCRSVYGFVAENGALTAQAHEQGVLALIQGMRSEGLSLPAIARELTRRGIPTPRGNATWQHSTVRKMLLRLGRTAEATT